MADPQRSSSEWVNSHRFAKGRLDALERDELRNAADARRRERIAEARDFCQPFMADHLDAAAMSLIMLREEFGVGNVTRAMVRERVRHTYPGIFNAGVST